MTGQLLLASIQCIIVCWLFRQSSGIKADDIQGYVKEEKEFVDEECGGAKTQEKPKGAGETKEKKQ